MKTNDLHKTLDALDISPVDTPRHQQVLKTALLTHDIPKQTLAYRLRSAAKNIAGVPMTHKKTFAGIGTLMLIAILALSITTYNYGHSPRAEAEQLANQGITFVHTIGAGKMGEIQSQLGGDPIQELETAKAAKDLTILTPDEFKTESAKHRGMSMSSLGKDGPQYGSVGISANGPLPTTPPDGGEVNYSTGGAIGSGAGEMGTVSRGTAMIVNGTAPDGSQPDKVTEFHSSATAMSADGSGSPATPPPAMPTPSKYLRYTDSTGHVVVLGLDDKGVPINKTVFMTDDDIQNMQVNGPKNLQTKL
jgi:hypothetical protein